MLLRHTNSVLSKAEAGAQNGSSFIELIKILRGLSLDEFGELFVSLPNPKYPAISAVLPAMADASIQRTWTGNSGVDLFHKTSEFVHLFENVFMCNTGKSLSEKTILDFGCGYGRLIRMMYYYTNPNNIWGVDPWVNSLNHCRDVDLPANLVQSEEVPESLPVADGSIEAGFSFSVFTHLTDDATRSALSAVRKALKNDGIFVCTIRPIEFWDYLQKSSKRPEESSLAKQQHLSTGYGFMPHTNPNAKHYGDSSFDLDFFRVMPGWTMVGYDTLLSDPYQIAVILKPS